MKQIILLALALILLQPVAFAELRQKLAPELIELIEAAETGNQPEKVAELFEFHYLNGKAGVNVQLIETNTIELAGFEVLENANGIVKGLAEINALKALAEREDVNFVRPGNKEFFDKATEFKIPEVKIEPQKIELQPWHYALGAMLLFVLLFFLLKWKKKRDYYHF